MESDASRSDMAARRKKKRGPYKKYSFFGTDAQVPKSTKNDWRKKPKLASRKKCTPEKPVSSKQKYIEDTSSEEDTYQQKKTEMDEQSEFALDENSDDVMPVKRYSIQPEECIHSEDDTSSGSFEPQNASTSSTGYEVLEKASTSSIGYEVLENPSVEEKDTSDSLIKSLLVLATKVRYNLTYEAAASTSKLMSAMSKTSDAQVSKYFLKKLIHDYSQSVTVHRICESCKLYVGLEGAQTMCLHCSEAVNTTSSLKSNSLFLYISLAYQLREIFETTTAHEMCENTRHKQREYAIEDIYDGELYKRNLVKGMISLNFSVDGAPIFDSSNSSIYPILCTINELEPRKRNQHVLLCGLWFGIGKPPINEFLKPFVVESDELYANGFTYRYKGVFHTKKCRILAGICDSIARPMLRNSTQFNGQYGCGLCLHPGENIEKDRGQTRVYPLILTKTTKNPIGEGLRSHEKTLKHAEERTKGMKGRSTLCDIPNFDIVESLNVDWMHSVNLGVCRQFAKLWFESTYRQEEFYIGNLVSNIDEVLLSYSPILEISRTPRRISDRVHWKAHEWAVWLLFYSLPTLSRFLPRKYLDHWALLVDGIQALCKTSIMKSEIVQSERHLIEFIEGVEKLYGRQHVSFNVHLLSHLGRSVIQLGPLWTHSAFVYENFNQFLLNSVKSSSGVVQQISDAFRSKYVVERLHRLCSAKMTKKQREYLYDILDKRVQPEPSLKLNHGGMLGTVMMHENLPRVHQLAFEKAHVHIDCSVPIASYQRAVIRGEVLHSKSYMRVKKRSSYYVQLINDEIFEIHLFYVVNDNTTVSCYALGRYFEKQNRPLFANRNFNHLIALKNSIDDLAIININDVKEKVMVLPVNHLQVSLACVLPNRCELLT